MADPTDTTPEADANVIDVTSFTSQIQGSLQADLIPDMQAVADLTKEFRDNLVSAQSASNLNITGDMEIEKMQQSLVASGTALESMKKQTKQFRSDLMGASDLTEARHILLGEQYSIQDTIKNLTEEQAKLEASINDDLVEKVKQEQAKLDLLPQGVSGYEAQEDALKQAQDNLGDANAEMALFTGQILAANKYNDDFLAGQAEMVKNATTLSQYQFDVRQSVGGVVQESNALLKVNEELRGELEQYGDNMKNFMESYGPMVDDVMGGFDKIGDSITGTLEQIPLIGGLLAKYASGPLGEAADIAKNAFGGAMKESFKIMQEGGSVTEAISGGMSSFVNGLSGMGQALSGLLSGPFLLIAAIAGLLYLAFKRFVELDAQAAEFRESLGLMAEHNRHIETSARQVSVELAHQGVLLEDAYKAATALQETFGTTHSVLKEDVAQISLMGAALGVSEQNAAGSLHMFKQMGASSSENARHLQVMTAELASAAGVGADQVMADIAGASEDTMLAMGGMPKQLAIAAVHLRKMGTSLDSMSAAAGKLLDFESSMSAEMKMSSMFGRHISLDKARQLAAAGDMKGLAAEQLRITKELGGWDQMNRWQKEAAAEALGMSVGDMGKMVQAEKEMELLANGTAEQRALAKEYQEALGKAENLTTEELAKQAEEKLKAQIQEKKMAQMQAEFNAMMVDLGEKLIPAVEAAMAVIIPILKTVFEWIGYIMVPFEHIGIVIGWISDGISWVSDQMSKWFGISEEGSETLNTIKAVIGGIIGYVLFFGGFFGKIFGFLWTKIKSMFSGAMDMVSNIIDTVGGGVKKIFETVGSSLSSLGKGIGDTISALAKGIGKGISAVFKGIGKGIKALADSLKNINAKGMLKAAAALLILAGAMWVSAKAFQEFAKVSWDGVMKGSVTLGVMTAALIAMSKTLDKNTKTLLKGVGIIALLGIAIMPAAEAFKMFAGIDWDSVFYGVTALASFAIVAGLIGSLAAKVALGALVIALLGVAMIPLVWGFQQFTDTIDWAQVWIGLGAMAAFATVVGVIGLAVKFIALGALAIALLGIALIPLAYGFQQFTDIEWNNVWIGLGAMSAFAVVAALLGVIAPLIIYGSIAMGVLGLAMIPLAFGFEQLTSVDWTNVWVAIGATAALAGVAALLGFFSPLIIMGSGAIAILGLALIPLGAGLDALLPAISGFVDLFGAFAESLSKITMENVLTLGALGLTMAGFALLLPAVAAGAATVIIMAWSIGKLGDAAGEAAPDINLLAEGLTPVIDKMLMISSASEKMRNASSVIREVAGAMASLGAGQAAQAAGGVVASAGGLLSGAMDWAGDKMFGTENVEKNKEGPIDKMIRLGESMGNLKGIEGTLQGVRSAVEGFSDVNAGGLASLGYGIRMLVREIGDIDTSSLSYLHAIRTSITGMMDAIDRISEDSTGPLKSMLECISNPDVFSVAVAGFDSLTESLIKFGEALSNISLVKLALLGLVSETDEAEKKLAEQPDVKKVTSATETKPATPTPEVAETQYETASQRYERLTGDKSKESSDGFTSISQDANALAKVQAKGAKKPPATPYSELTPMAQYNQTQQFAESSKLSVRQGNLLHGVGGVEQVKKLKELMQERDELKKQRSDLRKTGFEGSEIKEVDYDNMVNALSKATNQQFSKMQSTASDNMSAAAKNKFRTDRTRMGSSAYGDYSLGDDMKALLNAVEVTPLAEEGVSLSTEGQTAIAETISNTIESDSGTSNVQAGFELPSPATAPSVTETLATVNQPAAPAAGAPGGSEVDVSGVENNLVELIGLMKSGGIAVYLDSKKVSKGLAAAAED